MQRLRNWARPTQSVTLRRDCSFVKVQYLTVDQLARKRSKMQEIHQNTHNNKQCDFTFVIPYETLFRVSHRLVLNFVGKFENEVNVDQFLNHLSEHLDSQFQQFLNCNVNKILSVKQKQESLGTTGKPIVLCEEADSYLYEPDLIVEVIYEPLTFWEKVKAKAKQSILKLPNTIADFARRFIIYLLARMGFNWQNGVYAMVKKIVPIKTIISNLLMGLALFFPFLAPFAAMFKVFL